MKMCLAYRFICMQIKLIWKVLHENLSFEIEAQGKSEIVFSINER